MSGAKSRCMPQAASVALTCGDSKFSSSQARGEDKQQARRVERAAHALLAPQLPGGAGQRARAHRRAEQARRDARPRPGSPRRAAARSRRRRRRTPSSRATVFSMSVLTPNQRPSGKTLAKQSAAGAKSRPLAFQFICIVLVEGGAGEQAQIHRAEIVAEAGKRELARLDRAADRRISLENRDFPALQRQMRCAGQAVVARPDKDGVEIAHAPIPIPLCLKIIADA